MTNKNYPPFKANDWASPSVIVTEGENGIQYVRSPYTPKAGASNIVTMFQNTVEQYPQRQFLARRDPTTDNWNFLSYQQADQQSSAIAQWLINLQLPIHQPVMILSENSFEHALMMLGAMKARLPVAPVSPNYSLMSQDHKKLKNIFSLIKPGVVLVQDIGRYEKALQAIDSSNVNIVFAQGQAEVLSGSPFKTLTQTPVTEQVANSCQQIKPQDTAKILFTSGSTGEPKGVINTHASLTRIQSSVAAVLKMDSDNNPPVMLDWMPWHHTFAGNNNLFRIIHFGGTLYIDDGKPLPGLFEITIKNLISVPINTYTTVPAVYAMLFNVMKDNAALRKNFFKNLQWLSYGGSDMPQSTFEQIQAVAISETGLRMPVITALGSTESSAIITLRHWASDAMGNIGLPAPDTELKLVPVGDKYEMRVKGPQMTPGYFNNADKTQDAFDQAGYFKTGDAVRWSDVDDKSKGLVFAGRVCEDFKLLNGSWVHTDALRTKVLSALSPLVTDLVVAGQDKSYLSVLLWPNEPAVRQILSEPDMPLAQLCQLDKLSQVISDRLQQYNQENRGSTLRIVRAFNMAELPSADDNEISDKRSINQRAVLENRAYLIKRLYHENPDQQVIVV